MKCPFCGKPTLRTLGLMMPTGYHEISICWRCSRMVKDMHEGRIKGGREKLKKRGKP